MTTDKIKKLIDTQNERLEEDVARQAASIIREIGAQQEAIREHTKNIEDLRAALKKLEHNPIDAATIIG